jgi:hypothetical protein
MRPADTTRTCTYCTRPFNTSKLQGTCQCSTVGAILLLNFDFIYGERLALTLRGYGYRVIVPEEHRESLFEVKNEHLQQANLIVFDLTYLNYNIWRELRRICRSRRPDGLPLMLSCWSRIDRGPEFRLLVEKLGARLAYIK